MYIPGQRLRRVVRLFLLFTRVEVFPFRVPSLTHLPSSFNAHACSSTCRRVHSLRHDDTLEAEKLKNRNEQVDGRQATRDVFSSSLF